MAFGWKSVAAGLAALALLASGAAAQVPGPRANELILGLQDQQSGIGMGFARAAGPLYGDLASGGSREFPVTLRAGHDYTIAGVCDGRCVDLDLRIVDATAGALVAVDAEPDATPQTHVRPEMTGQHVIVVEMAACNAPSCWFAVNIYQR